MAFVEYIWTYIAPNAAVGVFLHRGDATALAVQGHFVLDADVPANAIDDLHATQRVDLFRRTLVARQEAAE